MSFNKRQFSILSDVLAYISDYSERKDCVAVYINIVRQPSNIFDLGAAFALGLMHAIKKNKSFAIELWIKKNVKQLLLPFDYHVKAARLGRTQCEKVLKTINKCWDLKVTGFFCSHNESEKILRQLAYLISYCFSYCKTQRLVNAVVVKRLLIDILHHLSRYETITADWNAAQYVDNILTILFACLAAANLHYGLFDELVESPPFFLPSDKPEDRAVNTYYRQYSELVAVSLITSNGTIYKNVPDLDDEDDKVAEDNDD